MTALRNFTATPAARRLMTLSGVGCCIAVLWAAALVRFPLRAIYVRPIQNLDKLTESAGGAGVAIAAWVLLLFAAFAFGARVVTALGRGGRLALFGFPLLFVALLFWTYPATSIDIYDYVFRGRMLVRYQANTFFLAPLDFNYDPLFGYVAWRRAVTAYGPAWEWLSWAAARLAGEAPGAAQPQGTAGLLALLLAYKALAVAGFLACGAAIWFALRGAAPHHRQLGAYLWLWNPLALWETAGAGHNDAWMALAIVVAVSAITALWSRAARGAAEPPRPGWPVWGLVAVASLGLLALTLGGLVKYLAFCFGPLLLLAALRRLPSWRARVALLVVGGLACAALVAWFYAPFWAGWGTLRQFTDRGSLFTATWLAVLEALLAQTMEQQSAQSAAAALGLGLLVAGVFWFSARAWRRPAAVAAHVLALLLWFLFVCSPWFQPWYLLWALAVVALQPEHTRAVWVVNVFCGTALLSYLGGSFLLPALGWEPKGAAWNALISVLIYLPPLLVAIWGGGPRLSLLARRVAQAPRALALRGWVR